MRCFLACLMVAGFASGYSVAQLKENILREQEEDSKQSLFAVEDFENGQGQISLTVAQQGQPVPLPEFLQKASWLAVIEGGSASPLKSEGFKYWTPQKDGFLFRNDADSKRIACVTKQTKTIASDKVQMKFSCTPLEQSDARFKVLPYSYASSPSFWLPVTNGCPYGYTGWNTWNYAYYAVTPMGYWGCPGLTSYGSCSGTPYYYPFTY